LGLFLQLVGASVLAVVLGGCGPALAKNDLGTVVFEVPKVAGADKPYPLPKLAPPDKKKEDLLRTPLR
jgi:hypothetical protein